MKEINLPSGAILKMGHIPFPEAMALNEAILEEAKDVKMKSSEELLMLYKDLFCIGFSSKKIKAALWKCLGRCIYLNDKGEFKITEQTFEEYDARQDYGEICIEVTKEVLEPFLRSQLSKLSALQDLVKGSQKLKPTQTQS